MRTLVAYVIIHTCNHAKPIHVLNSVSNIVLYTLFRNITCIVVYATSAIQSTSILIEPIGDFIKQRISSCDISTLKLRSNDNDAIVAMGLLLNE